MSLFGNYGKSGSLAKNSLFPDKTVNVAFAPPPQVAVNQASAPVAKALETNTALPCKDFRIDVSAQFGMCQCGFDRKAHERKQEVQQAPVQEAPAKAKGAQAVAPQTAPAKAKSMPADAPKSVPVNSSPKAGLFSAKAKLAPEVKPVESKSAPIGTSSTSTIAQLQALLQQAGFSTLPSDGGTAASKHISDLPDFVRSALLTIMQADPQAQSVPLAIPQVVETRQRADSDVSTHSSARASGVSTGTAPVGVANTKTLFQPSVAQPVVESKSVSLPQPAKKLFTSPSQTVSQTWVAPASSCHSSNSSGVVNQSRGRDVVSSALSAVQRYSSAPPQPPREDNAIDVNAIAEKKSSSSSVAATTPRMVTSSAAAQFGPVVTRSAKPSAIVRSASARFTKDATTSAPIVYTNTSTDPSSNFATPCVEFQLDLASTQFGMCQCGFDRNAHARKNLSSGVSESFRIYTLDQLQSRKATGNFSGLDPLRLECFLEEGQFFKAFGMDLEQFKRLPEWKKKDAKKRAEIF